MTSKIAPFKEKEELTVKKKQLDAQIRRIKYLKREMSHLSEDQGSQTWSPGKKQNLKKSMRRSHTWAPSPVAQKGREVAQKTACKKNIERADNTLKELEEIRNFYKQDGTYQTLSRLSFHSGQAGKVVGNLVLGSSLGTYTGLGLLFWSYFKQEKIAAQLPDTERGRAIKAEVRKRTYYQVAYTVAAATASYFLMPLLYSGLNSLAAVLSNPESTQLS